MSHETARVRVATQKMPRSPASLSNGHSMPHACGVRSDRGPHDHDTMAGAALVSPGVPLTGTWPVRQTLTV